MATMSNGLTFVKSDEFLRELLGECKVEPVDPLIIDGKQVLVVRDKNYTYLYVTEDGSLHCRVTTTLTRRHHKFTKGVMSQCNKLVKEVVQLLENKHMHRPINILYKHRERYTNLLEVNFILHAELLSKDGYLALRDFESMQDIANDFRNAVNARILHY